MAKQSRVTVSGSASPAVGSAVLNSAAVKRVSARSTRWKGVGRASGVVAVGMLAALAAPREAKALGYFTDNTTAAFPGPLPCLDTPNTGGNAGCFTSWMVAGDMDGDGDLDLMLANGGGYYAVGKAESSVVFQNDGKGVFGDISASKFGDAHNRLRQVAVGDIDGDGDLDMYQPGGFGIDLDKLWVQTAPGVYENKAATLLPTGLMSNSSSCHFGDLDGDGDLDLLVMDWFLSATTTPSRAILYKNDGTGKFGLAGVQKDDGFTTATDVFPPTIIPTGTAPSTTLGSNTQAAVAKPYWGVRAIDVDLADIDGDFDLDIIIDHRNGYSRLFINDGHANFTDGTHFEAVNAQDPVTGATTQTISTWYPAKRGPYVYNQEICDIDNDGDLDILLDNAGPRPANTLSWSAGATTAGGNVSQVLVNNGFGKFVDDTPNRIFGETGGDDNAVKCADVNNDGWYDIVVASLSGRSEKLLVSDGNGRLNFVPDGIPYVFGDSSLAIEMADLNGDKILDLVTGQGETSAGAWAERVYYGAGESKIDTRPPTFRGLETVAPLPETPTVVRFAVKDNVTSDTGSMVKAVGITYSLTGGASKTVKATYVGGDIFRAVIPALPAGSELKYAATATDRAGNAGTSAAKTVKVFLPDTPPATGGAGGMGGSTSTAGSGGAPAAGGTDAGGSGGTAGREAMAGDTGVAGEAGAPMETGGRDGEGGSGTAGSPTGAAGEEPMGDAGSEPGTGGKSGGGSVVVDDGGCSVSSSTPASKGRGAALVGLGLAMIGLVRRRRSGKP